MHFRKKHTNFIVYLHVIVNLYPRLKVKDSIRGIFLKEHAYMKLRKKA